MGRIVTGAVLVLGLIATACADDETGAATTALATTTSSTTSAITTTTSVTTTTTSTPTTSTTTRTTTTTTTTLPPAPPVEGWDGDGVREVAIEIDFEPALAALDMTADAEDGLEVMGIDESSDAAAVLDFDLDGTPLAADYGELGRCYAGAEISGTVRLSSPDHPTTLSEDVSYRLDPPFFVFQRDCSDDPEDAPYGPVFRIVLPHALTAIWGASAVPYLVDALDGRLDDSARDYPQWAAVMDAFRGLEDGRISEEDTREFLSRVIDTIGQLVESGNTPHGLETAARRVLEAYAGTDYGVGTEEDVQQWRDWLDGWEGP